MCSRASLLSMLLLLLLFAIPNNAYRIHRRGDTVGYYMDWSNGRWLPNMDRLNLLMVGEKEPDGSQRPVQFAEILNKNRVEGDHHTLYDVYDLEAAFGLAPGSTRSDARRLGLERDWFRATSAAFANLCSGLDPIWSQAIWATDELPALIAHGRISGIVEVRPTDIGRAHEGGVTSVFSIPTQPYRGGQPPGVTPPRDTDIGGLNGSSNAQVPMLDTLEAMGGLDVAGPYYEPLDPTDWTGRPCAFLSTVHSDGKDLDCVEGPTGPSVTYCTRGTRGEPPTGGMTGPDANAGLPNTAALNLVSGEATVEGNQAFTASSALEDNDSGSSSSFDKWVATILGLLSENLVLTLLVAGFTISLFLRRRQSHRWHFRTHHVP
ncbi:hypothetical protein DL96DRAFT_1758746 [Flagelloscypha sp. PMI_526]|nr:hypothetical protein DL96DRAFT_1758746 [Flagelloscypha sp. PMI_526]